MSIGLRTCACGPILRAQANGLREVAASEPSTSGGVTPMQHSQRTTWCSVAGVANLRTRTTA
jgi:hypothetical protein